MQVEKRDGALERKILIAMIVDKEVLGRITPKWEKDGLFKSRWSNIIGAWCVDHFKKYGEAPNKSIDTVFTSWASNGSDDDKDTIKLVEKFLATLSDEYEELAEGINAQYIVDTAADLFNKIKADTLVERVKGDIERGKVKMALERLNSFSQIEIGTGSAIEPFTDKDAIMAAINDKHESIVKYPGDLGRFFGDALERDGFVAFMAPDKTGKSFWLMDLAFRAMLQRRKVALFECGDMTQSQVIRRLMARVSKRPVKATPSGKPLLYPTAIEMSEDDKYAMVSCDERVYKDDLDWQTAWKACQDTMLRRVKSKESLLKTSYHPAGTISVRGIRAILQTWEREDWTPDVVVIDYADLLAPMDSKVEGIFQINQTWEALRAMSQALHCLVVTASQTNASAYQDGVLITKKNFSGNKMKLAHVTGMIGINQSFVEKERELCRLNWVVLRDAEFSTTRVIHVAGCKGVANVAVKSSFF